MALMSKTMLVVFFVGAGLGSIFTLQVTKSTVCEAAKEGQTKDFFDKSKTHIKIGDEQTF